MLIARPAECVYAIPFHLHREMNQVMTDRSERIGRIEWMDLTVENASEVSEFYGQVAGWTRSKVPVQDYHDFSVGPSEKDVVAGICHAQGPNAGIPPTWMVYINVENLDDSLEQVTECGGKVLGEIRSMPGHGRFCMISDPAGAVCSLFEPE